jgi:hypothetical protein
MKTLILLLCATVLLWGCGSVYEDRYSALAEAICSSRWYEWAGYIIHCETWNNDRCIKKTLEYHCYDYDYKDFWGVEI